MGEVISMLERKKKDKDRVTQMLVDFNWEENIKANKEKQKKIQQDNLKRNKSVIRAFNLKKNR